MHGVETGSEVAGLAAKLLARPAPLNEPRWYKHRYWLPETLIQVAPPDSAMLKIIYDKLIPWYGIIDAVSH
jgi:hypothetical protein